jgi:hypothetical protein
LTKASCPPLSVSYRFKNFLALLSKVLAQILAFTFSFAYRKTETATTLNTIDPILNAGIAKLLNIVPNDVGSKVVKVDRLPKLFRLLAVVKAAVGFQVFTTVSGKSPLSDTDE